MKLFKIFCRNDILLCCIKSLLSRILIFELLLSSPPIASIPLLYTQCSPSFFYFHLFIPPQKHFAFPLFLNFLPCEESNSVAHPMARPPVRLHRPALHPILYPLSVALVARPLCAVFQARPPQPTYQVHRRPGFSSHPMAIALAFGGMIEKRSLSERLFGKGSEEDGDLSLSTMTVTVSNKILTLCRGVALQMTTRYGFNQARYPQRLNCFRA